MVVKVKPAPTVAVISPEALIEQLEAKLASSVELKLSEAQVNSLVARIDSLKLGVSTLKLKEGGNYQNLPEGEYVSQVTKVELRKQETQNDKGVTSEKVMLNLTLKPLYEVERDDEGVAKRVPLSEDVDYGHHWVGFNTTVTMIHNPDAQTLAGMTKFIQQLGISFEGIGGIAPFMLDHDQLLGLMVFERVVHRESGNKTYVNSTLARDTSVGLNKSLGKIYKDVKENNTPILETWLETSVTYNKF
jgi:hypothetical protein